MKHNEHNEHGGHNGPYARHAPLPAGVNETAARVLDVAFRVHRALGPGLLESVYERCLLHGLCRGGLHVEQQIRLPVKFEGLVLRTGLRLDLVVGGSVVVELKAVEKVLPVHRTQLLTYLRLSELRLGLLLNFNTKHLRDGIERVIR